VSPSPSPASTPCPFKKAAKPEAKRFRKWLTSWNPWFVAADVCRACGIKKPIRAVEPLDAEKRV
jgi:prophage antirepressor-like protein